MSKKSKPGPPPGYKRSEENKEKYRQNRIGKTHTEETKQKIRESLLGRSHSQKHKQRISGAKTAHDLEGKCAERLQELRDDYPGQEPFFDENEPELLFAMRNVRSEKELNYIRRYVETARLLPDEPYQYSSSSCYAAEDVMIELLDVKRFLQKFH